MLYICLKPVKTRKSTLKAGNFGEIVANSIKIGQSLTKATDKKKGSKKAVKGTSVGVTQNLPQKVSAVDVKAAAAARSGALLYDPHLDKRQKIRAGITDMDIEKALKGCRRDWKGDRFHKKKKVWQYSLIGQNIDGKDICIGIEIHNNILVVTAYQVKKRSI